MYSISNVDPHNRCLNAKNIYFGTLIVAIVAVAAAILVLKLNASLLLSDKFIYPILGGYGLTAALLSIHPISSFFQKFNTPAANRQKALKVETPSKKETQAESTPEEPESEPKGPFLEDQTTTSKLLVLKKTPLSEVEQQKKVLRKKAKQRLVDAKKYASTMNWRQFALMNNTFLIRGSSFDRGHQTVLCLKAYIEYLTLIAADGTFFSFEGGASAFHELREVLQTAHRILSLFPVFHADVLDAKTLSTSSANILNFINNELEKKGFVYFPVGYCGRYQESNGHAIVCKISLGKMVTIAFLNLGEGVSNHPELTVESTHVKVSYIYFPIVISSDVWQQMSPQFIAQLLRFISDIPHKWTRYSSRDLYDLLAVFKAFSFDGIMQHADKFAAKFQDVGDCAEKCPRNIITDFSLHQLELSEEQTQLIFLNLHFTSIISAFYDYMGKPCEPHRELLINACEEFGNLLLRSKTFLQGQDYLEASEMIDIILQEVCATSPVASSLKPQLTLKASTLFPAIERPKTLSVTSGLGEPPAPVILSLPPFEPMTFKTDLQTVINTEENKHILFYEYILNLPIPKWGSTDEWDKVSVSDIPDILTSLQPLVYSCHADSNDEVLLIFVLFAVMDKLARRIDSMGILKNRTFPVLFEDAERYLFFPSAIEDKKREQVKEYLLNCRDAAQNTLVNYPEQWTDLPPALSILFTCALSAILSTEGKKIANLLSLIQECKSWEEAKQVTDGRFDYPSSPSMDNRWLRFLQKYKNFSSNDVLCCPKNFLQNEKSTQKYPTLIFEDYQIADVSKELLDELMLMMRHPELQVGLAIQWMQVHYEELNKTFVQHALHHALFSGDALKTFLRGKPEALNELKDLFDKGYKYYEGVFEHSSAILFLTHCEVILESYAADLFSRSIDTELLKTYETRLENLTKDIRFEGERKQEDIKHVQILAHFLFVESFIETRTEDEFCNLFSKLFRFGAITYCQLGHFEISSFITHRIRHYHFLFFQQLHQFLGQKENSQEILSRICRSALDQFNLEHNPQSNWQFDEGGMTCRSTEYVLNFLEGTLRQGNTGFALILPTQREREIYKFQEFDLDIQQPWWLGKTNNDASSRQIMISIDASTILMMDTFEPIVLKTKGQVVANTFALFGGADYDTLPVLKRYPFIHYAFTGNLPEECYILSCLRHEQKPYMRMDFLSDGIRFTRVNEQGKMLPYTLVNLEKLEPSHPLYAFTLRYASFDEVHCFIEETTEEIQELYFSNLDLSFSRSHHGLESEEFPGYCLNPIKIKALKSYSQEAIVLRNSEGKIKVILPFPRKEEKKLGFEAEHKKSVFSRLYFSFDLDSPNEPIPCKNTAEKLFLIFFRKKHGDYETAYSELYSLHFNILDDQALEVFKLFLNYTRDTSPFSLAVNQKLLLSFVDHIHLIEGYQKSTFTLEAAKDENKQCLVGAHRQRGINEFLLSATLWYEQYLRAATEDRVNGIPIEWRTSEAEEFRILSVMQRREIELSRMLKVRLELILSTSRTAEVEFVSQKFNLAPHAFKNFIPYKEWQWLKSLDHHHDSLPFGEKAAKGNTEDAFIVCPNQVSSTYCQRYFVMLYEQAKLVPPGCATHSFDFTLLTLLRLPLEKDALYAERAHIELASLLVYVRYFPKHFGYLSLANVTDVPQLKKLFSWIIYEVNQLQLSKAGKEMEAGFSLRENTFSYEKKVTLTLPEKEAPSPQPLPLTDSLSINPRPFESCFKLLFRQEERPANFGKEQLFESSLLENNSLEKEIVEQYESGLKTLASQKTTIYTLKPENLVRIKAELKSKQQDYQRMLHDEEKLILDSVNDPFNSFYGDFSLAEEKEFKLRLNARQTHSLTIDMIMWEAILKNSTALFDEHRPMLKQEHIEAILGAVHRYMHLLVLDSMCAEALDCLKKVQHNPGNQLLESDLINILNYEFTYSPEKFPEIAYMRMKTRKLPRKEQVEVYKWICEGLELNENRLFQLAAGAGKTSYLIPLLILRSLRYDYMAIVMTTQAMYGIEKENLGNTLSLLGLELDTMEIGMNTPLNVENLKMIQQQLRAGLQRKKVLLITPQTFYALRSSSFNAVNDGQEEAAELLEQILDFFEQRGLLFGDESHRIYDPMTQAILGLGQFIALKQQEKALLMALTKPLFGLETLSTGKNIFGLALSNEHGKGKPTKKDIQLIQNELAQHILKTFFVYIPHKQHAELLQFWFNKKSAEPAWVSQLNEEHMHLIRLSRYFFLSLLKQALKMKTDYEHMCSSEQGDIDTPAYNKTPSHAQFKDPCLTFILSIKGTWIRGLNKTQFRKVIENLKQQSLEEQEIASKLSKIPSQRRFKSWVKSKFPSLKLHNFDLGNQKLFDEVFTHCAKKPDVLEYFLTTSVLTNIGYSSEQFNSTPTHIMDGMKNSVIFSATPLAKLAYPRALKSAKLDALFETQVIAQASKPKNQHFVFPKDISDFFAHIAQNKEKYAHVRYMIDAGGYMSHEANRDVAEKWLASSALDGVIFFEGEGNDYAESFCFLCKSPPLEIRFKEMKELKNALAKQKIQFEALKIGISFDAAHAESAHFDPQKETAAFILAGQSLTLSHAIQAIMRERGFLNEAIDQRIIWVVQKELKEKMQGKCPHFSSGVINTWCLKNEVKAKKTQILMAAFQEITLQIEALALKSHASRQQAIAEHAQGFREQVILHANWASQKKLEETGIVLRQFAKSCYERFGFSTPFEDNHELKDSLDQAIQEVHLKIQQIFTDFHKSAVSEMHQKCVVKKQMRVMHFQHTPSGVYPEPIMHHATITESEYPAKMKQHSTPVKEVFETPHLTENFYIEINQLNTAIGNDISLKNTFLKTIDFILIVIEKDKVWAEAISNDLLPQYIKNLKAGVTNERIRHQAFIIRADGVYYTRGTGALAPDTAKMNAIMGSAWMEDVLIDAALLNGKITYSERFKERVANWPDFLVFWNKILTSLPLKKEISVNALLSFLSTELVGKPIIS